MRALMIHTGERGRRRVGGAGLCLAVSILLGGCGASDLTSPENPEDVSYAPGLGVDLMVMTRLPSGVYIRTTTAGEGLAAAQGDTVIVDYLLFLPDGRLVQEGDNVALTLSPGAVIDGFYEGMLGQKLGEVRKIVIPSRLAYAGDPPPGIPRHSVLVFDIRLNRIGRPR